jgi:hypothetical protein
MILQQEDLFIQILLAIIRRGPRRDPTESPPETWREKSGLLYRNHALYVSEDQAVKAELL